MDLPKFIDKNEGFQTIVMFILICRTVIARAKPEAIQKYDTGLLPASFLAVAMTTTQD
jgi:hypothetical protein